MTLKVCVNLGIVPAKQMYSGLQRFLGKKKKKQEVDKCEAFSLYVQIKMSDCGSESDVLTQI